MQIVIEVAEPKANFVLELLNSLPFVAVQHNDAAPLSGYEPTLSQRLSPKTTQLLGLFPDLTDEPNVRQQSVLSKHA